MTPIPKKLLAEILADPYYKVCARANGACAGRITLEHAWMYKNRQIQERWAIVPICAHHHLWQGLDKNLNRLIALRRATPKDLEKYPKVNWKQQLKFLEKYAQSFLAH